MNLILLSPEDLETGQLARVRDPRRLAHLRDVHRARVGDTLTLGIENGLLGRGTLLEHRDDEALFDVSGLGEAPPPALPVHLVLALPRPRMLARSLEHATALGVKSLTLLNTRRVEKSYWQSPELGADKIHRHLVLGLEQARDTRLPEVTLAKASAPSSRTTCRNCWHLAAGWWHTPACRRPAHAASMNRLSWSSARRAVSFPGKSTSSSRQGVKACTWGLASCGWKPPSPPCWHALPEDRRGLTPRRGRKPPAASRYRNPARW